MALDAQKSFRWLARLSWLVLWLPFALLALAFVQDQLGANPFETLNRETGHWTIRLLLATLAIAPLSRLAKQPALLRLRRPVGVMTFVYGLIHLLSYSVLDRGLDFATIGEDIIKRPAMTIGMAALLILLPLAVTSFDKAIRKLKTRWLKLHRLVYLAAILGITHNVMMVKADLREPLIHAAILAVLLMERLIRQGPQTLWAGPARRPRKALN